MSYDLYIIHRSPFCRSVMMLAKELGIDLNLKILDFASGAHLKPEYLALNPMHKVPTLVDKNENFVVCESRAIMKYLVDKVSPGHKLYPKDLMIRATIDRWLDFEAGTLVPTIIPPLWPVIQGKEDMDQGKAEVFKPKLKILDEGLDGKKYLVSDHLTIADLSILAFLSSIEVLTPEMDWDEFPNIMKWLSGLKVDLPYYEEVNQKGVNDLVEFVASNRSKVRAKD